MVGNFSKRSVTSLKSKVAVSKPACGKERDSAVRCILGGFPSKMLKGISTGLFSNTVSFTTNSCASVASPTMA